MRIPLFFWMLHFMELTKSYDHTKILRQRRNSAVGRLCQMGCVGCSALNGCVSCKPRLFLYLEPDGMRQRGVCLYSCPRGHYGVRSLHVNTCIRCREHCASCFSGTFCTHCSPGHFLFRGRCEDSCPRGLTPNPALRECTGHCEVGECGSCGQRKNTHSSQKRRHARAKSPRPRILSVDTPRARDSETRKSRKSAKSRIIQEDRS